MSLLTFPSLHQPNAANDDIKQPADTVEKKFDWEFKNMRTGKEDSKDIWFQLYTLPNSKHPTLYWNFKSAPSKQVNKTFMRKCRKKLLQKILVQIFHKNESQIDTLNKPDVLLELFSQLGIPSKTRKIKINLLEKNEMNAMIETLKTIVYLPDLLYEWVCSIDAYVENEEFIDALDYLMLHQEFYEFIQSIWSDICIMIKDMETDNSFELKYIHYVENYCNHPNYMKFQEFYNKNVASICTFEEISSICTFLLKYCFIGECRKIILKNVNKNELKENDVSQFESVAFGGTVTNTLHKVIYSKRYSKNGKRYHDLLQLLKAKKEKRSHVPQRLKDEDRGYMRIIAEPFVNVIRQILFEVQQKAETAFSTQNNPDLDQIVEQILNNNKYQNSFFDAFIQSGAKKARKNDIDYLYKIFMNSLCNKAIWAILKHKELNKPDVAFRMRLKVYHISQKRQNFH